MDNSYEKRLADKIFAEKLANKLVGYMLAEINYDAKNGSIKTDSDLKERFRDDYKAWKEMFLNPNEFITLYASEIEKLFPSMKNNWR